MTRPLQERLARRERRAPSHSSPEPRLKPPGAKTATTVQRLLCFSCPELSTSWASAKTLVQDTEDYRSSGCHRVVPLLLNAVGTWFHEEPGNPQASLLSDSSAASAGHLPWPCRHLQTQVTGKLPEEFK